MEKYSQFRDKGTQPSPTHTSLCKPHRSAVSQLTVPRAGTAIAPFLPVPPAPVSLAWTPVHVFLFLLRLPFVLSLSVLFFGLIEWLPVGGTIRYAVLWALLGATGVWWVDFQVDGVKRGYVPQPTY